MNNKTKFNPNRFADQLIVTGMTRMVEEEGLTFHEMLEALDDIKRQCAPAMMEIARDWRQAHAK